MEGSVRNVVLVCEGCGSRTVLGGPLSVWCSGSTSFECECGAQLTLSHQLDRTSPTPEGVAKSPVMQRNRA
jgi:hypothetical protein